MSDPLLDRLRQRAKAVRTRAAIRSWKYRQRDLAAGVWFRIRRVLADAKEAYAVSSADAQQLIAEGYAPEPCGSQLAPEKLLIFVNASRLDALESRRPIPLRLDVDLLLAPAIVLIRFDGS
jgi:hypothetical protein